MADGGWRKVRSLPALLALPLSPLHSFSLRLFTLRAFRDLCGLGDPVNGPFCTFASLFILVKIPLTGLDRGTMLRNSKFQFLTMEEFCALPRGEKIVYLDEAMAQIQGMKGDTPEHVIFKDSPLPPRRKPPSKIRQLPATKAFTFLTTTEAFLKLPQAEKFKYLAIAIEQLRLLTDTLREQEALLDLQPDPTQKH
jgi:hypothetical protein